MSIWYVAYDMNTGYIYTIQDHVTCLDCVHTNRKDEYNHMALRSLNFAHAFKPENQVVYTQTKPHLYTHKQSHTYTRTFMHIALYH